jgi:hypothetical protein
VLEVWADIDPSGVFEYLEARGAAEVRLSSLVLEILAANDYTRLLHLADARVVSPPLTRRLALQQWGQRDPNSALAYADAVPKELFEMNYPLIVAMSYGHEDPEAALSWAKSLQPPRPEIVSAVLTGIAETDAALALEVLIAELASPVEAERTAMRAHITDFLQTMTMNEEITGLAQIFDRVIAAAGTTEGVELARPMIQWSEADPRAAFEWARQNAQYLEPIEFSLIARRLTENDPTRARQALYGLPEHLQADWAGGVAIALAQQNDSGARDWLMSLAQGELRDTATRAFLSGQALNGAIDSEMFEQIADQAKYHRAVLDAAMRLACSDPVRALLLVDQQLDTAEQREPVLTQVRMISSAPEMICGSFNVY